MTIIPETRIETARGCGHRKKGGLYLVADGDALESCGRMPIPLSTCPCCGGGIKVSRGFTWIDGDGMTAPARALPCARCGDNPGALLGTCPLSGGYVIGRAGLLWVGMKFYRTPGDYIQEAMSRGISRRVNFVPKELQLGKTWVFLAHQAAVSGKDPGVFFMFRPQAVEVVCDGNETDDELAAYIKRGLTPVVVHPIDEKGRDIPLKPARGKGSEPDEESEADRVLGDILDPPEVIGLDELNSPEETEDLWDHGAR